MLLIFAKSLIHACNSSKTSAKMRSIGIILLLPSLMALAAQDVLSPSLAEYMVELHDGPSSGVSNHQRRTCSSSSCSQCTTIDDCQYPCNWDTIGSVCSQPDPTPAPTTASPTNDPTPAPTIANDWENCVVINPPGQCNTSAATPAPPAQPAYLYQDGPGFQEVQTPQYSTGRRRVRVPGDSVFEGLQYPADKGITFQSV